jgi:hypothetical protein
MTKFNIIVRLLAAMFLAVLTYFVASYIYRTYQVNAALIPNRYFNYSKFNLFYDNIVGAIFFLICAFKFRTYIMGVIPLLLSAWLIASSLQENYSVFNTHLLVYVGVFFETIAAGICGFVFITKHAE